MTEGEDLCKRSRKERGEACRGMMEILKGSLWSTGHGEEKLM
jgi:hypothetical protein